MNRNLVFHFHTLLNNYDTMKIAIIGYGKMGKVIEEIALQRNHTIVATLEHTPTLSELKNAEVAIEFSQPESAFENIKFCIVNNIPVISGTTGWLDRKPEIERLCIEKDATFLYASNYSLGVNLFFELNKKLANLMYNFPTYEVSMQEIHHLQKKDAPSGTAISLANDIIPVLKKQNWNLGEAKNTNYIGIEALRIENIPGTHSILYTSEEDEIEIKHTAFSRKGFALGAVIAAEFIHNKKGIFTMKEVLGF